jgi:hypothetical protein
MSETIGKIVDGITDNVLAFLVIGSAIYSSLNMQMIQDWHIAAVGAVMAYYFMK